MKNNNEFSNDHFPSEKFHSLKKQIILFCFFIFSINLFSQNFIPNPGFESYVQIPCGCMQGSLSNYIHNWENVGEGTPDFIHTDAEETCYASNQSSHWDSYGFENPHGGKGMGMIMTEGHSGTYREYLGVPLSFPMTKGREYHVEFYVSLGDYCGSATNNVGMWFTEDKPKSGGNIIYGSPQINHEEVIRQTDGWVKVSGSFIADADFKYVTIGNFSTSGSTEIIKLPQASSYSGEHKYREGMAAYYIDDFTVTEKEMQLVLKGDTMVNQGELTTLSAYGARTYKWVDETNPKKVLSYGPELNKFMDKTTTFVVYTDIDTAKITVDVKKVFVDEIMGRVVTQKTVIEVHNDEVQIEVYDKNYVDGDTLSLYDGNVLIASHVALEKDVKSFNVRIDRTRPTQIIVFAESEGTMPPNTACIILRDGKTQTEIILKSDFHNSDSVVLNYAGGGDD